MLDDRTTAAIRIPASDHWRRWAHGLADRHGKSLASLMAEIVETWATTEGYPDPPRRTSGQRRRKRPHIL